MMPQILAGRLGMPSSIIYSKQGDTGLIPMGGGHGSSRATYMGGTAICPAAGTIIAKGKSLAAQALEAAETDIVFESGTFRVTGTDRTITLLKLASHAQGALDTYHQWTRANPLGVKGCGEAGAVALFPAIANAIADAVGVTTLNGSASANRVRSTMRGTHA